jgi:hypothetical protein
MPHSCLHFRTELLFRWFPDKPASGFSYRKIRCCHLRSNFFINGLRRISPKSDVLYGFRITRIVLKSDDSLPLRQVSLDRIIWARCKPSLQPSVECLRAEQTSSLKVFPESSIVVRFSRHPRSHRYLARASISLRPPRLCADSLTHSCI